MENLSTILALGFGLLLRLAVPSAVTLIAVYFLSKLDAHWQAQAEAELKVHAVAIERPECWKIKYCPPEQRQACPAFLSTKPCWQVYRRPNAYLLEKCLACEVFLEAPIPEVFVHTQDHVEEV